MKVLPILNSDSYKQFHHLMYPEGITLLYSNMTPRKSRFKSEKAVWFGLQYYIKEYLIKQWNELFFDKPLEEVTAQYKRFHKHFSGVDVSVKHIEDLHKLGYMPIKIKALPEGAQVNMRVPFYTIVNTHDDFAWLVNFLETQMSTVIWDLTTVATISKMYRGLLDKWAIKTTGSTDGVQWQGHDFSQRGRSSVESTFNQAGHLLSFTGTDVIPAVLFLEEYYNANMETELIAMSVPATEHSVMTSYGKEDEFGAFVRLMEQFPTGILSIVSDSFDLWKVLTDFLPRLKEDILSRDGKIVIRPDSGDPVDIICGRNSNPDDFDEGFDGGRFPYNDCAEQYKSVVSKNEYKGVVELLWDVFGGTVNEKGYKVLDPHIGVIYGDSITLERAEEICKRLEAKGFASTNWIAGIGSYTFNMNTRDSLGIAVKSTYCEVEVNGVIHEREIFKDPITDDGTKKSAKGLLAIWDTTGKGDYILQDQVTDEMEESGALELVFENGTLIRDHSLSEIRKRLNS